MIYGPYAPLPQNRRLYETAWAMQQTIRRVEQRRIDEQGGGGNHVAKPGDGSGPGSARAAARLEKQGILIPAPGADIPDPNLGLPPELRPKRAPDGRLIPFDPGF